MADPVFPTAPVFPPAPRWPGDPVVPEVETYGNQFAGAATVAAATKLIATFGSAAAGLAPASGGGTTNYLRADGTWTAPSATAGPLTTISVVGTVTYTSQADMNKLIFVSNSGIANTINLPAAATAGAGYWLQIKDIAGTAGSANITIDPNGAETIDGAGTLVISSNYGKAYIVSNGSSWGTI